MAVLDAERAYTYAWWLTGEEDAAATAARAAGLGRDTDGGHLPALLAQVRALAIPKRTMCPASELALLHDGHGLSLEDAARIAVVDLADARTELAHGRLEALHETVVADFEHPERLGGLAVGNPADIAHARQCESCEQVRGLLSRGRDELQILPAPTRPPDLDGADEPAAPGERAPGRRLRWVGWAAAAAGGLLAAVAVWAGTAERSPSGTSEQPGTNTAVPSGQLQVIEPDAPAEPADGAFRVTGAGLVDPRGRPAQADPGDPLEPLRLAVRYEGAAAGVVLSGHWSVDGQRYRDMRVVLSGRRSTHVFGGPAPTDGWPRGAHEILLAVDGQVVGAVHFTVAG